MNCSISALDQTVFTRTIPDLIETYMKRPIKKWFLVLRFPGCLLCLPAFIFSRRVASCSKKDVLPMRTLLKFFAAGSDAEPIADRDEYALYMRATAFKRSLP